MSTIFYIHCIKTKQQKMLAKNLLDTHANHMKVLVDGKWISFKRFCTIPIEKQEFIMTEIIDNGKRDEYIRENTKWPKFKKLNTDSFVWGDSPKFCVGTDDQDELRLDLSNYFHNRVLKLTPKVLRQIKRICRTYKYLCNNEELDKFFAKHRGNYVFVLSH